MNTWIVISSILWILSAWRGWQQYRSIGLFEQLPLSEQDRWPRLSVLIASRDQAAQLRQSLEALLASNYPQLEIVVANDRSQDDTSNYLEQLAQKDARLRLVTIKELPQGWLGKTHALQQAVAEATGEYYLFTDADVKLSQDALRRAIQHVLKQDLEHFSVLPHYVNQGPLTEICTAVSNSILMATRRAHLVGTKHPKAVFGLGAFNLVKAQSWWKSGGFSALRLEVMDDIGVAKLIKAVGGKAGMAISTQSIQICWYETIWQMQRGLRKVQIAAGRYQPWKTILQGLGLILLGLGPTMGKELPPDSPVQDIATLAYLSLLVLALVRKKHLQRSLWVTILSPLGQVCLGLMSIVAGIEAALTRRLTWRDTHYSLAELRAFRRLQKSGQLRREKQAHEAQ